MRQAFRDAAGGHETLGRDWNGVENRGNRIREVTRETEALLLFFQEDLRS
jgi:hypothetical protein